jgi:hypothetical protein
MMGSGKGSRSSDFLADASGSSSSSIRSPTASKVTTTACLVALHLF